VVFIDADDRLLPRALEAGLNCLRAHPECAFVVGQHEFIAADGTLLSRDSHPFVERDHYAELLRDTYIWLPGTVMYRRDVFESVGGFDGSVFPAEDYQLYLRIAKDFPIRCHREVVAQYRKHGANQSGDPERMLKAHFSAYRSQWYRVKGDARYEEAYRIGTKHIRNNYGGMLATEVGRRARDANLKGAARGALVLLRYHPQTFLRRVVLKFKKALGFHS
jgi:GT2 family glycosyltransferase